MNSRGAGLGNHSKLKEEASFFYYQAGPGETDVWGILLKSFSVEGQLIPEYLDISSETVRYAQRV